MLCCVIPLVVSGHLPLAVVLVLVGRDLLIVVAAFSARHATSVLEFPPSVLGKLHTALVPSGRVSTRQICARENPCCCPAARA